MNMSTDAATIDERPLNEIDVSELLVPPVRHFLNQVEDERR